MSFFGLAYLSFNEHVTIKTITVTGNSIISSEEITKLTRENLIGAYMSLFSKKNIFLYPKKKIRRIILDDNLRLKNITMTIGGLTELRMNVIEREEYAVWCASKVTNSSCFYIDKDGFLFEKVQPLYDTHIIFTGGIPINEVVAGSTLEKDTFGKIKNFIHSFTKNNIPITSIEIKDEGVFSVYTETLPKLLLHTNMSATDTLANLQTILKNNLENSNMHEVEYIDLRFGNKIYIQRKTSE
jgi:cell division septal protein FtsQ